MANSTNLLAMAIVRIADAAASGNPVSDSDLALLAENAYELSVQEAEFWTHALPRDSDALEHRADRLDWSDLENEINADRLVELAAGARPTNGESELLCGALIERLFEEPDDDITPGLWTLALRGTDGATAVAVVDCWGYSWFVERSLLGVYRNLEDAQSQLSVTHIFELNCECIAIIAQVL